MENVSTYVDEAGNEITVEKTTVADWEYETRSKEGVLISQTILRDGKTESVSFYVFSREQMAEILQTNQTISFIYRHFQNSYRVDEYLDYVNGILSGKMISVYHADGNDICFQKHQIAEGESMSHSTEKSYYEDGIEKYLFEYNEDGTCFMIHSVQTYQEDIFAQDIGTSNTDFSWKGLEYYQFQHPLVPE